MKKSNIKNNKASGFTAMELLFALGIIAIATIAIVKIMNSNSDKAKTNQMVADVTAIASNVKGLYAATSDGYASLEMADIIKAGAIPTDLHIVSPDGSNTQVNSQFAGGTVNVIESDNTSFNIIYTSIPPSICNQVVSQLAADPVQEIDVGSTPVYTAGAAIVTSTVVAACANSTNSLTFNVN